MTLSKSPRLVAVVASAMLAAMLLPSASVFAADQAEFQKNMDKYLESDANLEKVGKALESYFKKKRNQQQAAKQQSDEKKMDAQFKNPVAIDLGVSPSKGKKDAKITVVEFSDFQCPFCSRGMTVMDDLLKEYPEDVKLVFKHLPLPFHNNAKAAARASLAAGEQGKFWEMHDALFKNQKALTKETFEKLASELKLDVEKFKNDMKDKVADYNKMIDEDSAQAKKLGIRGTPGFFVNGVQVRGARPLPYFKNIVERWKKQLNS